MKEYKIDFAYCDGGFEIIVSTNHTFKAKTEEEANKIASDLEKKILEHLNPYYDKNKKDIVIDITCNEYFDTAFISNFIIDSERTVNKNCYIEELEDEYEEYLGKYNVIFFESIAYGVNYAPISTEEMLVITEIDDRWINENKNVIEHRKDGIKWKDTDKSFSIDIEVLNMKWVLTMENLQRNGI